MNYAKMVFKQVAEFILIAFKFVSSDYILRFMGHSNFHGSLKEINKLSLRSS
jgi:hypothetical protein